MGLHGEVGAAAPMVVTDQRRRRSGGLGAVVGWSGRTSELRGTRSRGQLGSREGGGGGSALLRGEAAAMVGTSDGVRVLARGVRAGACLGF